MPRCLSTLILLSCILLLPACSTLQRMPPATRLPNAGIIPAPAKCELAEGSFIASEKTRIIYEAHAGDAVSLLKDGIQSRIGFELDTMPWGKYAHDSDNNIFLEIVTKIGSEVSNREAYQVTVTSNGIVVRALYDTGLFYGVQSLLQMIDAQNPRPGKPVAIPAVTITDAPRFGYRGLMLDEARHFFGKAAVKQTLDMMAYLKLNRLHWHLTDSQGWRVEIKKYPKLTQIGGQGRGIDPNGPTFYTQEDIKELVEYARARHIEIIPEIDMPGHATAATKSYPEISGGDDPQRPGFTFNPAKEQTYQFLADVMAELAQLFPGSPLNIGGDEVFFGNESWKTDPQILKFTRDQGLKNEVELEHYFIRRMAGVVNNLNRPVMGWDDIGAAGIDPNKSILLWWHHEKPEVLTKSLEQGFPIVMCPRDPLYFDFVQDSKHQVGRKKFQVPLTNDLARVYDFPDRYIDKLVPPGTESKILGMEACVWTESIASMKRLQFILYPRMAALAEDAWTPRENKNLINFLDRVRTFLRTLDRKGIYYYDPFDPTRTPEPPGPPRTKAAIG